MPRFFIYPKEGDRLELEFERFVVNAQNREIELYNQHGEQCGAFVTRDIAAVVPTELRPTERLDMLTFTVYLANHHDEPFQINGTHFVRQDDGYEFRLNGNRPVPSVYIDPIQIVGLTYVQTN
jgi:hypothetical protein